MSGMIACDYCDEGLPLWHRREPDEYGLEGAQFMPCELATCASAANRSLLVMQAVELCARMIDAGMTLADIQLVANLAKGHST